MRRTLAIITTLVVVVLGPATLTPTQTSAQAGQPAALHQVFLPSVNKPAASSASAHLALLNEELAIINAERAANGCGPVTLNAQLTAAAQSHSDDMAQNDYFSHISLDGTTPSQRVTRAGYDWSKTGENIAAGQTTAAAVMAKWMNSDGHRANILNCDYTEVGLGHTFQADDAFPSSPGYRHYWTQNFGRPWD